MTRILLAAMLFLCAATSAAAQPVRSTAEEEPSFSGLMVGEGDCFYFRHPRNETQNAAFAASLFSNLIATGVNMAVEAVASAAQARQAAISASVGLTLSNATAPRCIHVMRAAFEAEPNPSPAWAANTIYENAFGAMPYFSPQRRPDFFAEIAILHEGDGAFKAVPVIVDFHEPQFRRFLRPSTDRAVMLSFTVRAPAGSDEKKNVSFVIPLGELSVGEPRRLAPCSSLSVVPTRTFCAGAPNAGAGDETKDAIDYNGRRFIGETAPFALPLTATPRRWVLDATLTEVQGASLAVQVAADLLKKSQGDITAALQPTP